MKRREFLGKSGCGLAGLMAAPCRFWGKDNKD